MSETGTVVAVMVQAQRRLIRCPECRTVLLEILHGDPTVRAWCRGCKLDVVAAPVDRQTAMIRYDVLDT